MVQKLQTQQKVMEPQKRKRRKACIQLLEGGSSKGEAKKTTRTKEDRERDTRQAKQNDFLSFLKEGKEGGGGGAK